MQTFSTLCMTTVLLGHNVLTAQCVDAIQHRLWLESDALRRLTTTLDAVTMHSNSTRQAFQSLFCARSRQHAVRT